MKTLLTLLALAALFTVASTDAYARGRKPTPSPSPLGAGESRIVSADPASITVVVGGAGDQEFTYRITDSTKVTIDGAPVAARDLKAGMIAKCTLTPDHATAIAIDAKDPTAQGKHGKGL